ncbi:MAG: hypothetical protein LC790_08700 [Actinobacteria bacterium]|nr:hypothetical protein [Actinomycetota bacterium]
MCLCGQRRGQRREPCDRAFAALEVVVQGAGRRGLRAVADLSDDRGEHEDVVVALLGDEAKRVGFLRAALDAARFACGGLRLAQVADHRDRGGGVVVGLDAVGDDRERLIGAAHVYAHAVDRRSGVSGRDRWGRQHGDGSQAACELGEVLHGDAFR